MLSYQDYVAGWIDADMPGFIKSTIVLAHYNQVEFALIATLDSDPDPWELVGKSPALGAIASEISRVGSGILLPTIFLLRAPLEQIFFGFDEVWFLPTRDITPKPDGAFLVGPAKVNLARLAALGPWAAQNHCTLGLGSGEGLNFLAKAEGLVQSLLLW